MVNGKSVNGWRGLPEFQGWWNRVDVKRNAGFICLMLGMGDFFGVFRLDSR